MRIRLEDVHQAVWRRLLLPGGAKLSRVHDIFRAAMGWRDSHLHNFTIGDKVYGSLEDEEFGDDIKELDESEHTILAALGGSVRRFAYEYDFGDS